MIMSVIRIQALKIWLMLIYLSLFFLVKKDFHHCLSDDAVDKDDVDDYYIASLRNSWREGRGCWVPSF